MRLNDAHLQALEATSLQDMYIRDAEALISYCNAEITCLREFVARSIPIIHLLVAKAEDEEERMTSEEVMKQYDELVDDYEHLQEQFQNVTKQLQFVLRSQATEKVDAYFQQYGASNIHLHQQSNNQTSESNRSTVFLSSCNSNERVWWKFWTWLW